MQLHNKILIISLVLLISFAFNCNKNRNNNDGIAKVERGDIVDVAVALGTIEVKNEISIKSKFSGVVRQIFIEVGDKVEKGSPLLEIDPSPTPLELAQARKDVKIANIKFENLREDMKRKEILKEKVLISDKDYEDTKRYYEEAKSNLELAQERLDLIEKGKAEVGGESLETVIRSPINGTVLERPVNEGDPVVPLTSYQPGTELMSLASLENLLFKGTVDEIDVGRLEEGMKAEIMVGALPDAKIGGEIVNIAPKARKSENATVFDIEIKITERDEMYLRVGYSATADIVVDERKDVLVVPEGYVKFEDDKEYVTMTDSEMREIQTGLSDGLRIEVISGLEEGDEIKK